MKYRSVFDIIGPIMIGPSSSHTAGAVRIGLMGRNLFGRTPKKADILLFGSFAKTYKGHGTDIAIIGGTLGLSTYDKRLVDAYEIAEQCGVEIDIRLSEETPSHPNTAVITLSDEVDQITVQGISLGGGKIEITEVNGYRVQISGDVPTILVWHQDQSDVLANIKQVLANDNVKISHLEMTRQEDVVQALMIIETDRPIEESVHKTIESLNQIEKVVALQTIG